MSESNLENLVACLLPSYYHDQPPTHPQTHAKMDALAHAFANTSLRETQVRLHPFTMNDEKY